MDSDGSDHVRLTYDPAIDSDPALSPDGRRIAFVSRRNGRVDGIYVMDSDGEKLMQLTKDSNCSDPAWSPDGVKDCVHSQQRRETGLGDGRRRAKPDTVNSCGTELSPVLVARWKKNCHHIK